MPAQHDKLTRVVLPWLTPQHLLLGLAGLSLIIMLVGTCSMYSTSGPLPPPRKPPPLPNLSAVTSYRFKEGYYRSLVEENAKKVGLRKQDTAGLWKVNPFFAEFSGEQRLAVNGNLETSHLRLRALSQKIWVGEEGQGYRTEHMLLQISNRTDRYLAYRVVTQIAGRCSGKGILPHNALALKPGEEVVRSECVGSAPITVKQVEVLELSPLGYYYVSQLEPQRLRFDARTSEGHQEAGKLKPCRLLPWRAIDAALQRREATWYDVIDFYSRHSCDEYTYFDGYHRLQKEPIKLPAQAPQATQ